MKIIVIAYVVMAPLLLFAKAPPWALVGLVWALCFALWQAIRCIEACRGR
jgi:hypothetical protein